MASPSAPSQILPGRGLGYLTLGASLHNVLTRLKAQPATYPALDLAYSSSEPISQPVVLTLPANGIRMRFDGPDQRLRLIEILDFTKTAFSYKSTELVRRFKNSNEGIKDNDGPQSGPSFRHVYNRLFGPTYPGEYFPPDHHDGSGLGLYVLSYPGVAFSFPIQHSKWSSDTDFVTLLSSSAALPAKSMAIFYGPSWSNARDDLFTRAPQFPRSISLTGRNKEFIADEVEEVRVFGGGRLEVMRRNTPAFVIRLGETTPQDLVAELGPPDAIYRKYESKIAIHDEQQVSPASFTNGGLQNRLNGVHRAAQLDGMDGLNGADGASDRDSSLPNVPVECFYNYFHHGFDALISPASETSPPFPQSQSSGEGVGSRATTQLTVTKILLHGNVPGSYPFNRHRRSRWIIDTGGKDGGPLTSEMAFSEISSGLKKRWKGTYSSREEEKSLQRGMVLNRGWGESPDSSLELLGGWEESTSNSGGVIGHSSSDGVQGLGNTELFGFPGLLFEVLKNGIVSCLTVY